MSDVIKQWFEQSAPFQGILACGVRYADRTTVTKAWADGFTELALENALRCVADLFQVLQFNRISPSRVRWVYQGAFLYCERRPEGTCLGVFTPGNIEAVDLDGLERFFGEFQALAPASSP
jgi:hypothetical protein